MSGLKYYINRLYAVNPNWRHTQKSD